ncbi:MAG: hypothetical protein LBL28_06900 [Treponema sp.]|jgi:hypothetical protein|nr:hypothetical protein [Treponema sp.]
MIGKKRSMLAVLVFGLLAGGGVCVGGDTFTKSGSGGIIYESDAPEGQANKAGH